MPDASGRFRGIVVPRLPWHDDEEDEKQEPARRTVVKRGGRVVETNAAPARETR